MHPPPDNANPFLYTLLVFLHILTAMTAVGINISYVFWIMRGTTDVANLPFALQGVKFIDDYVANPCYLVAGATGLLMIVLGKAVASFLWIAIVIYLAAMITAYAIYTPLLGRQIQVLEAKGANDPEYLQLANRSTQIGRLMGIMVVVIIVLKIFEPTFW